MTVMTKDVLNDGDWGKEREVLVLRDEKKSFGISIVGGTVNVSDDTVVSGIFIKNIIPNSPADSCGLLKIGDRILAVDGIDISQSSHEHAVKTIKNADSKMILQVQSLVKKIDDCTETSTLLKKAPPPITPCKTPELELIHEGNEVTINVIKEQLSSTENINADIIKLPIPVNSVSQQQPDTDSDNSSDDEDVRDLEGKTYTKDGIEIDRASAGNIKRTKEEIALDTEEEDCFGYTASEYFLRGSSHQAVFDLE
ncbi:inactivation-no-after-potential D protein-like isoform X3 [Ochlerotatus camptorhynchus]